MTTIIENYPVTIKTPETKVSGIDDLNIDPEDIVYGEYASGNSHGAYAEFIYLDGDKLKIFEGYISRHNAAIQELLILLKDENKYYLVPIKEIPAGFAFKRKDIVDIKSYLFREGDSTNQPWCGLSFTFEDKKTYKLETEFQAYFTYGNTIRPISMTNEYILDKVFSGKAKN